MSDEIPLEHRAFCVLCGVGVAFDEDGCCTGCGCTVCSVQELRDLLFRSRLHIVTEAERKVLDACAELPESTLRLNETELKLARSWPGSVCKVWHAELARRTP